MLFLILGYFIYARLLRKSIVPQRAVALEPLPPRDYTPQDLARFNGKDDGHILLALNRKVYDVTVGAMFYGPK